MSEVKIKFFKQAIGENQFEVISELVSTVDKEDIRHKWALLGMRYAKIIGEKINIDSLSHIQDTGAEIVFTKADYFEDMDFWDEDDFSEFEAESNERYIGNLSDKEIDMTLGIELNVYESYKRIGGLLTPSVVMARILFSEIDKKRDLVKA